jgi:hypothetical protein
MFALPAGDSNGETFPPWQFLLIAYGGLALLVLLGGLIVALAGRSWRRRRRVTVIVLAVLVALLVLAPIWSGYFGPTAAAYSAVWRPWRTDVSVVKVGDDRARSGERVEMEAFFHDRWPELSGGGLEPYVTVERLHPLLPWIPTRYYYTLL